mmetsp:Transcript_43991/g.124258  ORF Transcript_43991/g.124258 Transcript_43991/m.124258 type:complete len:327 (-) Transcript_43991:2692-3672(-)
MEGSSQSSKPKVVWQGWVSSKGPSQKKPLPRPFVAMDRCLRCTPAHLAEQSLHADQFPKAQSTLGSHGTSALQTLCSMDAPVPAWPHSFASTLTVRDRHVCPPAQVAEHGSHAPQSAHSPSTQSFSWHLWRLQPSICDLSWASQGLQPGSGETRMCRDLERWPPSHGLLHTVQSLQLPHWQSLHLHLGRWAQGFTSSRCCSQPKPSERREVKERLRFAVPAPQEALHASHADHWLTMQSEVSHASVLQPLVSMRSSGQGFPPELGFRVISRFRVRWPPPHDLSHASQAVHSETSQSAMRSHISASFMAPSQGAPVPSGCCRMERIR